MAEQETSGYLADICEEAVSDMQDAHAPYLTRIRDGLLEAAQRLREMDGEMTKGWVPNWPSTNGIPVDEFVEFHLKRETAVQGDQNVARALLLILTRKGE